MKKINTKKHDPRGETHTDSMMVRAVSPLLHQSARKLRLVTHAIGGLSPSAALEQLPFIVKRASDPIGRTIRQAVANATNNLNIPKHRLRLAAIEIQEGPTMKRYRAGPRGMAKPIKKRTSRVVVQLFGENNGKKEKIMSKK